MVMHIFYLKKKGRIIMSITLERQLAIDESWHRNYLQHTQAIGKEVVVPQVQHVAANDLTRRELGWCGIATTELDKKLVAIIPIQGPMSKTWEWRGTNTEWVSAQIRLAADNINVVAIVLRMDTPGGTVNGTASLAKTVAESSVPVIAHTDYMCASAGIWVASKAQEHWISSSKTTGIGSIGVISMLFSMHEYNQKQGLDYRILRSKGSENKALGHHMEPINDQELANEQSLINDMRVEMLSDIRSSRPQISEDIDGAMYYGSKAIRAFFLGTQKN
jgi:ClpP class serine protease